MAKYRKKPIVVEAFRWEPKGDPNSLPEWFLRMLMQGKVRSDRDGDYNESVTFVTREGTAVARPGDYVIRGVGGEIYPCDPEIFKASYEVVEER